MIKSNTIIMIINKIWKDVTSERRLQLSSYMETASGVSKIKAKQKHFYFQMETLREKNNSFFFIFCPYEECVE